MEEAREPQPGITIVPQLCPAGQTQPCYLADTDLQNEIVRQIDLGVLPPLEKDSTGNTNTYYAVYFPPYISLSAFGAGSCVNFGFCAYHNTGTIGVNNDPFIYGAIMDTFSGGCSSGCGANTTALENTEDVSSHELAEATTDADIGLDTAIDYAYPAGWGDNNNNCGEIADICDDNVPGATVTVSGRSWVVQELWSNALNKCVASGLHPVYAFSNVPSSATPGAQFNFTLTVQDPWGNKGTDIAYNGSVHFTSSDTDPSVVLPADYTFTSTDQGTASFAATLETASPQTITATDTQNSAITMATSSIPVSAKLNQSILFTTNAPATAVYGSNFTVAASAISGLPVAFTSSGACSNVGTTYTMISGTGTCYVIANQAGNGTYNAAPTDTETTSATLASQSVNFTTNAPASATYNTNFTVVATSTSTLPVAFTSSGSCSNVGATYIMTSGTGTCYVIANQSGNSNYAPASTNTETTSATKANQTISFTTNAPASAPYQGNFTVVANATSGDPVAFTSSGACTNVGATYTMIASTGTCDVIANQSGNGNYNAAPQSTEYTTATKATPTVTFTGAPAAAPYQSSFTVTAATNASKTAIITTSGACTNTGTTITITKGTGTCTMTAQWAADNNYFAASATQTTIAEKQTPILKWATPAPIIYGTLLSGIQLDATASYNNSPLAGTFVYTPKAGKILNGGSETLSVVFTPTQSAHFATATDSVMLVVNPQNTTTLITGTTPAPPTAGTPVKVKFRVAAAHGYPTQTVEVNSTTGESCRGTLKAGTGSCTLVFAAPGPRRLIASYSGDNNDLSSTSAELPVTVNP